MPFFLSLVVNIDFVFKLVAFCIVIWILTSPKSETYWFDKERKHKAVTNKQEDNVEFLFILSLVGTTCIDRKRRRSGCFIKVKREKLVLEEVIRISMLSV